MSWMVASESICGANWAACRRMVESVRLGSWVSPAVRGDRLRIRRGRRTVERLPGMGQQISGRIKAGSGMRVHSGRAWPAWVFVKRARITSERVVMASSTQR